MRLFLFILTLMALLSVARAFVVKREDEDEADEDEPDEDEGGHHALSQPVNDYPPEPIAAPPPPKQERPPHRVDPPIRTEKPIIIEQPIRTERPKDPVPLKEEHPHHAKVSTPMQAPSKHSNPAPPVIEADETPSSVPDPIITPSSLVPISLSSPTETSVVTPTVSSVLSVDTPPPPLGIASRATRPILSWFLLVATLIVLAHLV